MGYGPLAGHGWTMSSLTSSLPATRTALSFRIKIGSGRVGGCDGLAWQHTPESAGNSGLSSFRDLAGGLSMMAKSPITFVCLNKCEYYMQCSAAAVRRQSCGCVIHICHRKGAIHIRWDFLVPRSAAPADLIEGVCMIIHRRLHGAITVAECMHAAWQMLASLMP